MLKVLRLSSIFLESHAFFSVKEFQQIVATTVNYIASFSYWLCIVTYSLIIGGAFICI
jgi:hypothetical protein